MPELVSKSGIEVIDIPIDVGRFKSIRRMFWENTALIHFVRRWSPDAYLTFSHYLPSRNLGVPSVVAVSNLAPFSSDAYLVEGLVGRLRLAILRKTIISSAIRANAVIALSNKCKMDLVDVGVASSKIFVIPNGVEQDAITREGTYCAESNDNLYILSVSHFYRYKNFEQLLRAYSIISTSIRDVLRLKIVGKFYDEKYVAELLSLAKELGISSRVDFIPGLDGNELRLAYRSAKIFVFTSLIENSPNILLEAMAYGLPILSSDTAPMPEFGGNAIAYFKSGDEADLARKIETLLGDQVALDELGRQALKQAKNFSWDVFTMSVTNLCAKVSDSNFVCRAESDLI